MKRLPFIFLFILASACRINAQVFLYAAKISGVQHDSLYRIQLNPSLRQYMQPGLGDLRIYDSVGKEVPYLVLSEPQLKSTSDFINYEIVSQNHFKNYSEIIIHNPDKNRIGNIAFNINNSDAHKYCAIEGSEDMKQWFSVSASQELSLAYNGQYSNSYKCIYFPMNNYAYFRLLVEDWQAQPLKINSAGYFKNSVVAGRLNEVASTNTILTQTTNKKTLVQLVFNSRQPVDRIDFKIRGPRLFKRHAVIYASRQRQLKRRTENYLEPLFEFEFNSGDLNPERLLFRDVPQLNENNLMIEIENKDNPPLEIELISCKQRATFLLCDLAAGNAYTLKCGNDSLAAPEYDLGSFVPENPEAFSEAILGPVQKIKKNEPVAARSPSFFETKAFLWLCLVLGALAILFFSQSLLKDMSKKNKV